MEIFSGGLVFKPGSAFRTLSGELPEKHGVGRMEEDPYSSMYVRVFAALGVRKPNDETPLS